MTGRRVVVTGIGAITPLGDSLAATIAALVAGRSAVGPATLFDASGFECADAAEIRDWDPRPSFRAPKALKLTDRPARFAVAAARMAVADAAWPDDAESLDELGVVLGTSGSDLQARDIGRALAKELPDVPGDEIGGFARRILAGLNPLWLLVSLPNMTSAHVAIQLQARGPNSTIMSDWVAGHQAIGEAAEWIRAGEARAVLAGGTDSGVQPLAYAAYQQAGMFGGGDSCDDRFVPGEGAAVFLLEDRDRALARGAHPRAEIRGYASSGGPSLAHTLTRSLSDVLSTARWRGDEISHCSIAAPRVPRFAAPARDAVTSVLGDSVAPVFFEPRLGHPLASAAPIDAALMIANRGPDHASGARWSGSAPQPQRWLSSAVGCSGESVTLAFETGHAP